MHAAGERMECSITELGAVRGDAGQLKLRYCERGRG